MSSSNEARVDGHLQPVHFDLWLPRGPQISWQVLSLRGREALSQPFGFTLELWCDDPQADLTAVLGADCELLLERNGLERRVYGLIAEVELLFSAELQREHVEGVGARVEVVPALALLAHESDTRFFTGQSVPEIVAALLGARLGAYGRSLDCASRLVAGYPRRDYCVQFRESTLDFCARLLAEEGIAYFFEADHDAQRERMVLCDENPRDRSVELVVPEPMPVGVHDPEELDRESLQALHQRHGRGARRVLTRGYNYKLGGPQAPGAHDDGLAESPADVGEVALDLVLDQPRRQIIDDPRDDPEATHFDGSALDQQPGLARRLLEQRRVNTDVGRGQGNAIGFTVGAVFEVEPSEQLPGAGKFLLTQVEHVGRGPSGALDQREHYHNQFRCIADDRPYRPPIPAKPRVHGVQTGVVVGKTRDEVHTDALGRVRVAFANRSGDLDEHATCWIRVAQVWAGPGYGAMVIPRVGMEVVVAFVDGDP
ncbi:MAG: type VI secretion system tip protein VgrG, partial [Myxococcales bacterium]|nr:type VI secretion system tip protein VgrG [Myxococcales bacterium]